MKKILLSQRIVNGSHENEINESLDINWSKLLESAGLLAIPIPLHCDHLAYIDNIKPAGIILTGGNDLSHISMNQIDQLRDKMEFKIIDICIEKNIPLFGVCRGMQIIAKYFNISLKKIDSHIATHHVITLSNKVLKKIYGEQIQVNSYHQYSLEDAMPPIACAAKCITDNSIEAITHSNKKILGIMWHPERKNPFYTKDIALIKDFFNI